MSKWKALQQQALKDLSEARDHARVQLHLLSSEARGRWQELESKIDNFERGLEQGAEQSTERVLARARELTELVIKTVQQSALGSILDRVRVSELMTEGVHVCSPDDSLNRPARLMWEKDCGVVPVISETRDLLGMITDRDLAVAAYTQGRTLQSITVATAMSREVYACRADDSLHQAVRLMSEKRVRRLPVVIDGRLVGLLALSDIARYVAGHVRLPGNAQADLVMALAKISEAPKEAPKEASRASAA